MFCYADVARWTGVIAGALMGVLMMAQLGAAQATPANEVPDAGEEIVSETPEPPELPESSVSVTIADTSAKSKPAPRSLAPADNGLVVCVAGCVGPAGSSVLNLAGSEYR